MSIQNQNLSDTATSENQETVEQFVNDGNDLGQDGDFAGALQKYRHAAESAPSSSSHLIRVAEGYAANDQPFKAVKCYQRALQLRSESSDKEDLHEAHMGMGDLCRSFALTASAIKSYERAVRSRPKNAFYRWKLAAALTVLGLYDKAHQQIMSAVDLEPADAYYRFQLAEILTFQGKNNKAAEQLRQATELAPTDDYYYLRLGAALLRAGRPAEAVTQFDRACRMKPENRAYDVLQKYALMRRDKTPEIAIDIEMLELDQFDEDFVTRIQTWSKVPSE